MSLPAFLGYLFISNALTFGNGPVLVPLLQSELVQQRHVLTTEQLLYAFTIARVTPGQANLYVASVGYMRFGLGGAGLAVLAILLPAYSMVPLLRGYEHVRHSTRLRRVTGGLTSASVGLISAATLDIARSSLQGPVSVSVCVLALLMLLLRPKWNPILVLVASSTLGLLLSLVLPAR